MVAMPFNSKDMAEDVRTFVAGIEAAQPRWLYCLSRVKHRREHNGRAYTTYAERTLPVCERILGSGAYVSTSKFRRLDELGFDGAYAALKRIPSADPFAVGPLEAWHAGHVYFARVVSHPHVLKIGFSRRVRERLEDIEAKNHTRLYLKPGHLKVGTLADEHWWHRDWERMRISGEWFFDPRMPDRSLPDFLARWAPANAESLSA